MRKRLDIMFFFGFLAVSLFGCGDRPSDMQAPNRAQPNMNDRGLTPINANSPVSNEMPNMKVSGLTPDTEFIMKAAQGGMAEVELGKLAATKAQSPEVKNYAQKMVDDHSKVNGELKALAARKNLSLPDRLDIAHQSLMDRLKGLSGAEFDKAYVEAMVDEHQKTVELFKNEVQNGDDGDVKKWANSILPTLQAHLEMIKNIQAKMK